MSETITLSPTLRPSRISITVTEVLPNLTGTLLAVAPPSSNLKRLETPPSMLYDFAGNTTLTSIDGSGLADPNVLGLRSVNVNCGLKTPIVAWSQDPESAHMPEHRSSFNNSKYDG